MMRSLLDFKEILYYLRHNYCISRENLVELTIDELAYITERFAYRMAIVLKYENTYKGFDGKLATRVVEECIYCEESVYNQVAYEFVHNDEVCFLCEDCFNKHKMEVNIDPVYDLEGLC